MRYLPEILPRMYITDMNFDDRGRNGRNSIPYCYRSVCVAARVKNDTIDGKTGPLQFIDQLPFYIALKIAEPNGRIFFRQLPIILLKSLAAIYLRLPRTQQVQIGAIDDCYIQ